MTARHDTRPSLWSPDTVVAHIRGGLGNQLFQIVAARRMAGDRPLWLDLRYFRRHDARPYVLPRLGLDERHVPPAAERLLPRIGETPLKRLWPTPFRAVREGSQGAEEPAQLPPRAWLLGYWQQPHRALVRRDELQNRVRGTLGDLSPRGRDLLDRIRRAGAAVVHARRGDYVTDPGARATFVVQDAEYYRAAMSRLRDAGCTRFHVFTDDPAWAQDQLSSEDCSVVPPGPADDGGVEDFLLMTQAPAIAMSNSSYSWWAAVLSPAAIVIAPSSWYRAGGMDNDRLLLPSWVIL